MSAASDNKHLYVNSPLNFVVSTSRAFSSDTSRSNMPRSASIVTSRSVTSIVPLIGELMKPIFALRANVSVDPCQFFCSSHQLQRQSLHLKHIVEAAIDGIDDLLFRFVVSNRYAHTEIVPCVRCELRGGRLRRDRYNQLTSDKSSRLEPEGAEGPIPISRADASKSAACFSVPSFLPCSVR